MLSLLEASTRATGRSWREAGAPHSAAAHRGLPATEHEAGTGPASGKALGPPPESGEEQSLHTQEGKPWSCPSTPGARPEARHPSDTIRGLLFKHKDHSL